MNRRRIQILAILAVLSLMVTSLAGCGGKKAPAVRTELNVRLQYSEAKQFDPSVTARASEYYVIKNIFNGLVRFKPGGFEIMPDLADKWEQSADGKEITFHLHKGVKFHKNYGELTSEDVVFTFERLKNPKSEMSYLFGSIIKSIEAPDKYTVKITLSRPYVPLFTLLAYRNALIVSKKAVTELGDKGFAAAPIGTGPFEFQEMTTDKLVILNGFKDYFEGASKVTKITFNPITEDEVAAMALEKGELDVIWIRGEATIADRLSKNPDLTVKQAASVTTRFVGLNPKVKPLADVRVRRALSMALNRQAISEATGGFETPAKSIYNPLFFAYTEDVFKYDYNVEAAKALLKEAGYEKGFDLTLLCSARSPDPVIAQVIQASWKAAGINVKLNSMEHGAYSEAKDKGDYETVLMGVGRPPDPDMLLMEAFHSTAIGKGRANNGFYKDADAMIEAAAGETDPTKRAQMYRDIAIKILDDMPQVPVTNTLYGAAWRAPVIDYVPVINNEFLAYTIKLGEANKK